MDNNLLDDTYQQTFEGTVKNALTITKLEREHTLGKLRCLANNNNITRPVESSVVLKMLCKYYLGSKQDLPTQTDLPLT